MTSNEGVPSKAIVTKILASVRSEDHGFIHEAIIDGKQEALLTFGISNRRFDHQCNAYRHLQQQGLNGEILPAYYGPITIVPHSYREMFALTYQCSVLVSPQAVRLEFFPKNPLRLGDYFRDLCQDRRKQVERQLCGYLHRLHRAGLTHGLVYEHKFILVPDTEGTMSIRMVDLSASRLRQSVSASEWTRRTKKDLVDLGGIIKDLRGEHEAFRVADMVESSNSLSSDLQEEISNSNVLCGKKWYTRYLGNIIMSSITELNLKLGVQLVKFLRHNSSTQRGLEFAEKLIATYEQSTDVKSIGMLRLEFVKLMPWSLESPKRRLILDAAFQFLRASLGPYDKLTLQCRETCVRQLMAVGQPGKAQYILWKDLWDLAKLHRQRGGGDNSSGDHAVAEAALDVTFCELADALAQDCTDTRMKWWVSAQMDWLLPGIVKLMWNRRQEAAEPRKLAAGDEKKRKAELMDRPAGTEKKRKSEYLDRPAGTEKKRCLGKLMEIVAKETWG